MTTYGLVCPFLTDDPTFAYGVEFGLLYARMQSEAETISDYFCRENQDRILLLASRLGWAVKRIKPWNKDWFWCALEKEAAPAR
ncbi:MAG TPA: hypothetical protein VJ739_04340 [Gemmataceae bacterium]|nr:hypothetical protein [Gemmataceae bacterium]